MPLPISIRDGGTSSRTVTVDQNNALFTSVNPIPPFGRDSKMRIFRQYLTANGTSSGSNDMRVNGAVTPVDFWIPASGTADRYICSLSFVIADAGASLSSFGNIAALVNGCRLFYSDHSGEVEMHGALRTNFDFIRLAGGQPAFGDNTTAFRAPNVSGPSEAFIPFLDLRQMFGFQWGVRLATKTTQRITLRVRDSTLAVDQFDCIAYGFERLPD